MSLGMFRRTPILDEFMRSRDDMDRMLGDRLIGRVLGSGLGPFEPMATRMEGWAPPVDVSETDDEIVVRTEIPGIATRDLEITITGTALSISGKKEEKEEMEQEDFYRCERRFGAFRRVIDLPETIDADRISADSDNGVVTIRVAKKPGQRAKRIEVKPTSRRVPVPG